MKVYNTHNIYNPIFLLGTIAYFVFNITLSSTIHYDNTTLFTKGDTIALVATARKKNRWQLKTRNWLATQLGLK
jgi:uncharacterized membrane protein